MTADAEVTSNDHTHENKMGKSISKSDSLIVPIVEPKLIWVLFHYVSNIVHVCNTGSLFLKKFNAKKIPPQTVPAHCRMIDLRISKQYLCVVKVPLALTRRCVQLSTHASAHIITEPLQTAILYNVLIGIIIWTDRYMGD